MTPTSSKIREFRPLGIIATAPSFNGAFEIRFSLVETENGRKGLDIRKFANGGPTRQGITLAAEEIENLSIIFNRLVEAQKGNQ